MGFGGAVGRFRQGGTPGFTLIEMLIVVGIIVALAAVVVPSLFQFTRKGQEGAKEAERSAVESAITNMMIDNSLGAVQAAAGSASNSWTVNGFGTGAVALAGYLQNGTTTYYCWDTKGKVTGQDEDGSTSC